MKTQAKARTELLVTLNQAVEDYLLIQRVSRDPKTVERARYSLRKLLDWCEARNIRYLHELTRRELLTWSLALQHEQTSKSTQWTVTSTVKAFLRWCEEEQMMPETPLKSGDFPHKPKPSPRPLSVSELRAVLKAADGTDWIAKRDVAMLTVLLHSGCRRGELLQMKAGDVERGFALVEQKGGRQHVLHLNADCVRAIMTYLHALQRQKGIRLEAEAPLWIGQRGEPLQGNSVRLVFRRLSQKTGMRLYAHRFRHTSATLMLASGAPTEVVREALGHADLRSIQSYVKLAQQDVRRLLEASSPLRLLRASKQKAEKA